MRDDDHPDLKVPHHLGEQVVQPLAIRLVQVSGRLVGQHDPGLAASARATAVRCCSPPLSSEAGDAAGRPVRPVPASSLARSSASTVLRPAMRSGNDHILKRGKLPQQVVKLKDEPHAAVPDQSKLLDPSDPTSVRSDSNTSPDVGRSSPPSM